MLATDPVVTFLLVLVIGIVAGILFDRLAGPSWLARQFSGSTRGIITSALVGVAGAFVGYHIAVLLALGGGLVTSVIVAAAGAVVVLFAWRMAKYIGHGPGSLWPGHGSQSTRLLAERLNFITDGARRAPAPKTPRPPANARGARYTFA